MQYLSAVIEVFFLQYSETSAVDEKALPQDRGEHNKLEARGS